MENDNNNNNESIISRAAKLKILLSGSMVTTAFVVFSALLPILMIVSVFLSVIGANHDEISSGSSAYAQGGKRVCNEIGFSVSTTSLSKEEFKNKLAAYAETNTQWNLFVEKLDSYYDYAKANNVNPELVVTIAQKEHQGTETTPGTNNYWGLGCPNGATACEQLKSFEAGAQYLIDTIASYNADSVYDVFFKHHYSYIGDYWLNPGSSGSGGCYYAPYIYPDNMPERVAKACANGNNCKGSNCEKTVHDEDQAAYSTYLVKIMANFRKTVFGLEPEEGGCTIVPYDSSIDDAEVAEIITWDNDTAWQKLIGITPDDARHPYISEAAIYERTTKISVPMRMWKKDSSGINPHTDTEKVMMDIRVNRAIAKVWQAFFEDVYNYAPEFVIASYDGCYEYRDLTNHEGTLSPHAYGVACDLNASITGNKYGESPFDIDSWLQLPETRAKYSAVYKGSKVVEIAHKYTITNGSDWSNANDAMHFSFASDLLREKSIACQGKTYCD